MRIAILTMTMLFACADPAIDAAETSAALAAPNVNPCPSPPIAGTSTNCGPSPQQRQHVMASVQSALDGQPGTVVDDTPIGCEAESDGDYFCWADWHFSGSADHWETLCWRDASTGVTSCSTSQLP